MTLAARLAPYHLPSVSRHGVWPRLPKVVCGRLSHSSSGGADTHPVVSAPAADGTKEAA